MIGRYLIIREKTKTLPKHPVCVTDNPQEYSRVGYEIYYINDNGNLLLVKPSFEIDIDAISQHLCPGSLLIK